MENKLFLLLRIGLGTDPPTEDALRCVSEMTGKQWADLRDLAERQGASAIALDGLNCLISKYGQQTVSASVEYSQWKLFVLEWTGSLLIIEQANQHQIEVMNDLAGKWSEAGCRVMVMKGQANATFYPHPNHRATGDIDCYLFKNYSKGNDIAREMGANVDESWYKHSVISYKEETFENHQYFVTTRSVKDGNALEKELEDELRVVDSKYSHLSECVLCPPIQWTAMFLTYHSCSHFISEGLRLKQLLDWALFIQKHQEDVDWPRFYGFCERHHLSRFADVSTYIAVNYFGVKISNANIRVDSPYAERVLQSALYDDDFVFGSGKGNWYNRFHLVRNLWTYRWKYRDIYQMSPLRKLWYYFTGYIFKTE